jgi:hypothetical protein
MDIPGSLASMAVAETNIATKARKARGSANFMIRGECLNVSREAWFWWFKLSSSSLLYTRYGFLFRFLQRFMFVSFLSQSTPEWGLWSGVTHTDRNPYLLWQPFRIVSELQ